MVFGYTEIGIRKYEKYIMAPCHAWLCPACQIELSIKSYQTELSNSETITPITRSHSSKSIGREGNSSWEGLMGQLKFQ